MNESAQTVTNWGTRGVSAKAAAKAQSLFGVSSAYILEGSGPRFVRAALSEDLTEVLPAIEPRDLIRIPLLANSGSMGKGNDTLDADYVVGDLALSAHWINQYIKPGNIQELKFIHAQGESMSPTFSDGDVLLVDVGSRDPASHEGVYVLDVHGQTYIKRVRMRMTGSLEVSSDNPNIKTVDELNGDHQVRVLGRVVWAWNGQKL
ncbi:S24 family peptidase [Comamonas testosteroni]|uniref:S24 family peptidase n=1 Tax=Comamonas testosteroni TaxID=285 RepID=UPI00068A98FE|nr:S24 family peptidase [Comamonas testosteroni]